MKSVLVTGSEGFTGRYVKQALLKRGYKVVSLVYENPDKDEISCDLTDFNAITQIIKEKRPDGVIHLAALSFVGHKDESAFYNVNIFGALNILKALETEGVVPDKVIMASSANVYGNPGVETLSEESPVNPINHYAASKLAMEYMVKTWFQKMSIIITRPFNYTGPGQSEIFLVPKIVKHYRDDAQTIELGNLDISRDFSDVRDIAEAYCDLYESEVSSEIFNLSSARVYSLNDILIMMNDIAGYEIDVSVNKAFIRKNEIKTLCGSNKKLKEVTGFKPTYDLKRTLVDMFNA